MPSGYSLFTNFSFDLAENAMKIINYEKKEMIPLTDEENKSCEEQKICYICKKEFSADDDDDDDDDDGNKKYQKSKISLLLHWKI